MKKKQVSLEVFQQHVFPSLQLQFATDPENLQKTINSEYEIYEEDAEGKKTPILWRVNIQKSPPKEAAVTEEEIQERVDKAVALELEKAKKELATTATNKRVAVGPVSGEQTTYVPATLKRFGAIKHFAKEKRNGLDQDERCFVLGMWAMACNGHAKAIQWCEERGMGHNIKVHSEGLNTTGGYTVPDILSQDMIDLKETYGVARRLFDKQPMSSDTLRISRRVTGLTGTFIGENSAANESTMGLDQVMLVAKDLAVITRLSGDLNADSILNWSDRLAYEIGYAFALKEDQCAFIGDGTSTYGGITGIRTALTNKWSTGNTPGVGVGLIKQGTSTTWAAIVLADFNAVVGSLPQYADSTNCCWIMHRTFYYTVVEKLVQASGGVVSNEVREGRRGRPLLMGYPVEFSQVFPSVTASASVVATLGDHSLAATFGDRAQDSIAFSTEASVAGQSMWERYQIGVRGIERFDIVVHDVGDGSTVAGPIIGLITG